MVSDFTLSRQRENIAGLEVGFGGIECGQCWSCMWDRLKSEALERLPAAESSFEVVPPFELIAFVALPTEQDDAAVAHRGKIN
jgi:hypothetical protein